MSMHTPWLVADVGGTNVRFALAEPAAAAPLLLDTVRAYRVADFATLADAARAYIDTAAAQPAHAVFALAGRVEGDQVQMTNHAWAISAAQLQRELALDGIRLVNDFGAIGMGLPLLQSADLTALGPPVRPIVRRATAQTFCVLGPGTGLGVSALAARGDEIFALQTEGGHVSFAPTSEEEIAVLRQLMARFGRVSNERLLCGSGLVNLHQALCAIAQAREPALTPEQITARAAANSDAHCVHAVELFCRILGAAAGDMALSFGAWDGVFLAGGLLQHMLPWLQRGQFRERFDDKGRFGAAIAQVPVAVITHPQPGLLGSAGVAVMASGNALLRTAAGAARA